MVVMIHTTTWYITNAHSVSPLNWDMVNVLNSASRVSAFPRFYDFRLSFLASAARNRGIFFTYALCLIFTALSPAYISLLLDQRRAFAKQKCAAKTRVLPPVVFLCDCGDSPYRH